MYSQFYQSEQLLFKTETKQISVTPVSPIVASVE